MTGPAPSAAPPLPARAALADLFALDLRSLALLRVGLALLLLGDLALRAGDLRAHYTDAGVLPRSALPPAGTLSLHLLGGSAAFQGALFAVAAAFAAALLVGWRTPLATAGSWFLLVSLHARNPVVLQGGDILLRVLLFWSLFLPLGARWSLDALRRAGPPPGNRLVCGGGIALLLQVCFVYWFSVALKSDPCWRADGTAVEAALRIEQLATPLGQWLLQFPTLLKGLTWATLALEAAGPALLFFPVWRGPVRTGVVLAFVLFHLVGLNLCLELGPFPYVCAAAWLALLPGWFWDRAGRLLPGFGRLAEAARSAAARRVAARPRPCPVAVCTSRWLTVPALLFLAYVFVWNVRTLDFERCKAVLPERASFVGDLFGIGQYWAMFAPRPLQDDGWYVLRGTLRDGTEVDLFAGGRPCSWDRPARVAARYPNERWRKYLMNLWHPDFARYRQPYTEWLWREWNARHAGGQELEKLEVCFMLRPTRPAAGPRRVVLCQLAWEPADDARGAALPGRRPGP